MIGGAVCTAVLSCLLEGVLEESVRDGGVNHETHQTYSRSKYDEFMQHQQSLKKESQRPAHVDASISKVASDAHNLMSCYFSPEVWKANPVPINQERCGLISIKLRKSHFCSHTGQIGRIHMSADGVPPVVHLLSCIRAAEDGQAQLTMREMKQADIELSEKEGRIIGRIEAPAPKIIGFLNGKVSPFSMLFHTTNAIALNQKVFSYYDMANIDSAKYCLDLPDNELCKTTKPCL